MEHKFKMAIKILNIFMVLTLLNSCGNSMNMMGKNGVNGGFYKKNGEHLNNPTEPAECPCCQGADRHFYTLTNGLVILYCDECTSYWINPKNLGSHGAVNRYGLEKYCGKNIHDLFNEKGNPAAHQAVKEEVQKSEWSEVAKILTY